jgi:hypothetical protein
MLKNLQKRKCNMNLRDLTEIWSLIKPSLRDGDPREAADLVVQHLIDVEGHTFTEIKKAFGNDSDIKEALSYFSTEEEDDEDDEDWDDDADELEFE